MKPFKGEKRKDGMPKNASDKETEAREVCFSIERAERFAKAATLTEQAAKKIIGEIMERTTGEALHDHKAGNRSNRGSRRKRRCERARRASVTGK